VTLCFIFCSTNLVLCQLHSLQIEWCHTLVMTKMLGELELSISLPWPPNIFSVWLPELRQFYSLDLREHLCLKTILKLYNTHLPAEKFLTKLKRSILVREPNSPTQCCGSGSGIRCFFTPRIRDPEWSNGRIRIRDKQTKFVNSLYTKIGRIRRFFTPRIRDPDPGWSNDPDP
jgi:hypothetical protein